MCPCMSRPAAVLAAAEGDMCPAQLAKGRTEQDRADASHAGAEHSIN